MSKSLVRWRTYVSSSWKEPGSSSFSIRSRAVYLPFACCFSTAFSEAWSTTAARSSSSCASRSANVSGAFWRIAGRRYRSGRSREGGPKRLVERLRQERDEVTDPAFVLHAPVPLGAGGVAARDRRVQCLVLGQEAGELVLVADVERGEERAHLPGQPVPLAGRAWQAGGGDDRGLVSEIRVGGPPGVAVAGRGAQALELLFEGGLREPVLEHQLLQRQRAERGAQRVHLEDVERRHLGHDRAAVGDQLDQAVALEQAQRLADRSAGDAELLGQRDL